MDAAWDKGLDFFDKVYGAGARDMIKSGQDTPFMSTTVRQLFGEMWAMPHLSIRDKRLLVIGATTMLGRADLLAIQIAGAIVNEELNDEQFEEMRAFMIFYAGAGNTTALSDGIRQAKVRAAQILNAQNTA